MARKVKSVKKKFSGVNASELALVFSIAITLFVAGALGGGMQLTTNSKAAPAVEGQVRVCGRCTSIKVANGQAGLICGKGMECIISRNHEGSGENPSFCRCKAKTKDSNGKPQYDNPDCYALDNGTAVELPERKGPPGYPNEPKRKILPSDSCWKIPVTPTPVRRMPR